MNMLIFISFFKVEYNNTKEIDTLFNKIVLQTGIEISAVQSSILLHKVKILFSCCMQLENSVKVYGHVGIIWRVPRKYLECVVL